MPKGRHEASIPLGIWVHLRDARARPNGPSLIRTDLVGRKLTRISPNRNEQCQHALRNAAKDPAVALLLRSECWRARCRLGEERERNWRGCSGASEHQGNKFEPY